MIVLLHGDDIETSRQEFTKLKKEARGEVRSLEGKSLNTTTLTQATESQSLFGDGVSIFIDNLLTSANKKSNRYKEILEILKKTQNDIQIVLWENKEVDQVIIKTFGNSIRPQLYKYPQILFQFLDSLKPSSAKNCLLLLEKVLEREPAEVMLTLITRRVRQLIMIKDNITPEGLQGWQASRLTIQSKSFTMEKLLSMYKKLFEIDYSVKTGSTPFTLTQLLEQFIIDL